MDNALPLKALDNFFTVVFLCESVIKIIAYGLITTKKLAARDAEAEAELEAAEKAQGRPKPLPKHFRYLDDAWNRLDFFIVITSIVPLVIEAFVGDSGNSNTKVLRTLRMLRPLRTINSIPEMRVLIDSLGESAKPMANVMLLCMFLFLVFALIGQQLFSGSMTQRCYRAYGGAMDPPMNGDLDGVTVVDLDGTEWYASSMLLMPDNRTEPIEGRRCGGVYTCPLGYECRISGANPVIGNVETTTWGGLFDTEGGVQNFANPNMGMTNYDDIGHALLNIFVAITLEGWTDQMYWLQDSYGMFASVAFFLCLIIFGSLFALNLALAVISDNYSANVRRDAKRIADLKAAKEKKMAMLALRKARKEAFAVEQNKRQAEFEARSAAAARQAALADAHGDEAAAVAAVAALEQAAADLAAAEEAEHAEALEAGLDPKNGAKGGSKSLRGNGVVEYRPRNPFRRLLYDICTHGRFESFILFCIFLNTLTLAIPYYTFACLDRAGVVDGEDCVVQGIPMDQSLASMLETGNTAFLYIFTSEAVMKIIGLGWGQYAADGFNLFDGFIVLMGYMEYLPFDTLPGGGGMISAFRIFRLARVFKAAKYWPSMQAIVQTLIDTLPSLGYLTVVLFLLMFIAACTGMQLFGSCGIPYSFRSNFSDFGSAMLTVFQILTGEDWNTIMYMAVAHTNYASILFFIITFIVGGFVVLNLYLAILLSAFDCGEPPEFSMAWVGDIGASISAYFKKVAARKAGRDLELEIDASSMQVVLSEMTRKTQRPFDDVTDAALDPTLSNKIATKEVERHVQHRQRKNELIRKALTGKSCGCFSKHNRLRLQLARVVHTQRFDNFILLLIVISTLLLALESPSLTECGTNCPLFVTMLYMDVVFTALFVVEMLMKIVVYGFISTKAAYLKDPWNVLDFVIVMVGSVSLVMSFASAGADIAWIRSLRALRALRPLRTIKRAPGMRMAVNTLFDCAPAFLNIGCVAFVFYLAFAIIGVEFFGGRFWACNDGKVKIANDCVGVFWQESDSGRSGWVEREWANPAMNFDNTAVALLTLFEVASLEQWLEPMYSAMDLVDFGVQPSRNANRFAALYFVVFILFGCFLVMNLFVGAVVDNFNRQADKDEPDEGMEEGDKKADNQINDAATTFSGDENAEHKKSALDSIITPGQKAFVDSVGLIFSRKPIARPSPPVLGVQFYPQRRWCYNAVMWGPTTPEGRKTLDGSYFELIVMSVVLANTVTMLCYSWAYPENDAFYAVGTPSVDGMPDAVVELQQTMKNQVLDRINDAFTILFNFELALKLAAWGRAQYWSDTWNKLDAWVVVISDVVLILENGISGFKFPLNPNLVRILRLTKLMRILRVMSYGKEVLFLIETLVYSFPAIANVAALWFLVIFIYTVIGVSLYGEMPLDQSYSFGKYNEHANFATFGTGIVTLFRMSTGESWNGIMHDVMNVHPTSCIFFFTYILLVAYLLFNLLVAIVLEQFHMEAEVSDPDEKTSSIVSLGGDQMAKFQDEWVRFDPYATQFIKAVELPLILRRLPEELCVLDDQSDSVAMLRCLSHLSVNVDLRGNIHFAETYIAIVQYAYNLQIARAQADQEVAEGKPRRSPEVIVSEMPGLSGALLEGLVNQIVAHYPALAVQQLTEKPIVEYYAAQRLQSMWLRAQARKNWDAMLAAHREKRAAQAASKESSPERKNSLRKGLFSQTNSSGAEASGGSKLSSPSKGERAVGFSSAKGAEESKDNKSGH